MRKYCLLALLLWLTACGGPSAERIALPALALSPASVTGGLSLNQRLSVSRLDAPSAAAQSLDALLEIDARQLQLAGFAFGQRVLTLSWDGVRLDSQRHPLLPAEVDPQRIVRDVMLAYASVDAIRTELPAEWQLTETDGERRLLRRDVLVVLVRYPQAGGRSGLVELENRQEGYRLQIESSPVVEPAS